MIFRRFIFQASVAATLITTVLLGDAGAQTSGTPSAEAPAQPPRASELARVEGWLRDLDTLVATVRQVHWYYRECPFPAEFDQQRSVIRERLPTWSDARVVVELQRLVATLHDGHTLVYPFGMQRGRLARVPIALYDFDDGLAVIGADSAHSDLIGHSVLSIEGLPSAEVLGRLRTMASAENSSQLRWVLPVYVTFPEYLRAAGIPAEDEAVRFTIATPEGQRTVAIPAETGEIDPSKVITGLIPPPPGVGTSVPLALSRLNEAYWFTTLPPDDSIVYVQLNRVVKAESEPLAAFAHRLLDVLDLPSTARLVIDVRFNSGGDAGVLPPFIGSIIAFHVRRPAVPIYVLIGRQTFSAAQTLVNRLEEYVSPIFVGEETGSKPNRFGNERSFKLPFSGVVGGISSGYNQAASSRDTRIATSPAITVGLTVEDWLSGRDPVLDAATR